MKSRDISEREMTSARCPGDLCDYFSCHSFSHGSEKEDINSLLHGFCESCSLQTEQEPLCDFCRHLRLRHLTICLRQKLTGLCINLDLDRDKRGSGISRIVSNIGCTLCNLLANVINSYFVMSREQGENEEDKRADIVLLLWLRQEYGEQRLALSFIGSKTGRRGGYNIEIAFRQCLKGSKLITRGGIIWPTAKQWFHRCCEPSRGWGPGVGDKINWPSVRNWIRHCTRRHRCTRLEFPTMPQGFRLVDLDKQNLVSDFPSGSKLGYDIKFVTLSYVWGNPNTSRTNALLGSNKRELTAPGGLGKLSLPKAIADAIIVCQQLKQRFLWVDRLCIQQDDDGPEKRAQINAMGDIYSSAELTIIHASGASMDDPIAGVTTTREVFQSRTVVCGLELISGYPDMEVPIQASRWNERGWVYQEAVLSRRKLFFTPFELWFECSSHDYDTYQREEQCSRRRLSSLSAKPNQWSQFRIDGLAYNTIKFDDFVRHLESYTERSLTHQSDILDAFTGILTTLYEGGLSIYGLPEADFDQALLWYSDTRWRTTVDTSNFPSWSWPSVTGTVTVPNNKIRRGFLGTFVQWQYQDSNGKLRSVNSKNTFYRERSSDTKAQVCLLVAWWKGCVEPAVPEDVRQELEKRPAVCEHSDPTKLRLIERIWGHLENHEDCVACESQIAQRWPNPEDLWKDMQRAPNPGSVDTQHHMANRREEERQLKLQLRPGVLLTRAQTTYFKSVWTLFDDAYPNIYLIDLECRRIGEIRPGYLGKGREESLNNAPFECMGISLSDGEELVKPRPVVNVLIIHREEGSQFWRRIAIGWVYLPDWIKSDRTFKTIGIE
ncbi:HET-domain-containing protein [Xylaria venustula]|nr:HET-domain-containing protein [Xylaria venustula]